MSSDLLYSLGLDITDFKTSAKASKEAADDIKQGFKGFKDVLAAGGVSTAVLGFFSSVIDYAQQAKGPIDENTAAVRRFGTALDEGKKTAQSWGVQFLGTLNQAGERLGLMFDSWIMGETKALVLEAETRASIKASSEAREKLNEGMARHNAIIEQKKKLEEEFNSIADEGLTKQEKANFLAETARAENEKLRELKKGTIAYGGQQHLAQSPPRSRQRAGRRRQESRRGRREGPRSVHQGLQQTRCGKKTEPRIRSKPVATR